MPKHNTNLDLSITLPISVVEKGKKIEKVSPNPKGKSYQAADTNESRHKIRYHSIEQGEIHAISVPSKKKKEKTPRNQFKLPSSDRS